MPDSLDYPLRVAVYGPESTGKTSLAAALAAHFGEPWSSEYVRDYWDSHGGRIEAGNLEEIARGQIAGEEEAAAAAKRIVFSDTDLLTCVLWDDLLFPGACAPWIRTEADRRARGFSLYLFCDTDLPFESDPQRCFPDEKGRAMCRTLWREALSTRGLPFVEIRGCGSFRFASALAAVESLLVSKKRIS